MEEARPADPKISARNGSHESARRASCKLFLVKLTSPSVSMASRRAATCTTVSFAPRAERPLLSSAISIVPSEL